MKNFIFGVVFFVALVFTPFATLLVLPSVSLAATVHTSISTSAIEIKSVRTFPTVDLFVGSRGDDVKNLQQFLAEVGSGPAASALAAVGVTGYFGAYTRSALAEYQLSVGISPAAGYYGAKTRAYLSDL